MSDGEFKMVDGPHQPVEDQLAIHLLLNQYCHVVDRGTVDEIAALFSEDGILRPLHEGPEIFEGRDAVRAWYEDYDKRVRAGRRHRRHRITVPFITITGDTATVECCLDSSCVLIATNVISVSAGRYEDKLVKVAGQWLFKERAIYINHIHQVEAFREVN
ncbi:MAG: nuclear transport factor 2 family protein [Rhodospirillaceae bacterium]|jgi:hypothetical protein|nr:nuclear transport factor 2 family protein [Rhodospirillaceae bacterium]MBT5191058.1 nuclear transport factor 2 family protein [Rhodospirillaceae bacterium]MBT5895582.1 nuclear transport factor 2 family protein [Rhodospirillaceae bacterium]MBT6428432.1 nuclear transport factor 2 family protein [Rhodospirillaceae bacterium]MBT7758632.1 nuclear transport factor 2 family protein [Rhodospirillaceae bacterium]